MDSWSQKLAQTYYQCLESTITAHLNRSFPQFSLQNQEMCHGTIGFVLIKIKSCHIEIIVTYRLPIGLYLGISMSNILRAKFHILVSIHFLSGWKRIISSKKKGDVTHLMKEYAIWGTDLFWFPTFSPNYVNNKIWNFIKVTGVKGHHHLTFDIWLAHKFIYTYSKCSKVCVIGIHMLMSMSSMEIYKYLYILLSIEIMIECFL